MCNFDVPAALAICFVFVLFCTDVQSDGGKVNTIGVGGSPSKTKNFDHIQKPRVISCLRECNLYGYVKHEKSKEKIYLMTARKQNKCFCLISDLYKNSVEIDPNINEKLPRGTLCYGWQHPTNYQCSCESTEVMQSYMYRNQLDTSVGHCTMLVHCDCEYTPEYKNYVSRKGDEFKATRFAMMRAFIDETSLSREFQNKLGIKTDPARERIRTVNGVELQLILRKLKLKKVPGVAGPVTPSNKVIGLHFSRKHWWK